MGNTMIWEILQYKTVDSISQDPVKSQKASLQFEQCKFNTKITN